MGALIGTVTILDFVQLYLETAVDRVAPAERWT